MMIYNSYVLYNYPVILQTFLAYIFVIAGMDIFDTEDFYNSIEMEQGQKAFNRNFNLFGVDTKNYLVNTGSLIPIMVILILLRVVYFVVLKIVRRFP